MFLQALAQGMMPLTVVLDSLTAERFTLAVSRQIDGAKINAECVSHCTRCWRRNFQRHSQIERSVPIDEVCLSLDSIHPGLLIRTETEWEKHTARGRQEGYGVNALKVHNALVIHNCTLWPERRLDALVSLVGFTGLADASDSQLSSKLVRGTKFAIHTFLQCKFVGCLFSKGYRSDIIGSLIECVHGVKQCLSLFSCRSEFQEHRLFHRTSVHPLREVVSSVSPLRRRAIHPPLESRGLPCPIFVKNEPAYDILFKKGVALMTTFDIAHQRLLNQHIAGAPFEKPADVVQWMGAVQAQDYASAKWALGLRLQGATDAAID